MRGRFVKPDPNTTDDAEKVAIAAGVTGFVENVCRICGAPLKLAVFKKTDADEWDPLCLRHEKQEEELA